MIRRFQHWFAQFFVPVRSIHAIRKGDTIQVPTDAVSTFYKAPSAYAGMQGKVIDPPDRDGNFVIHTDSTAARSGGILSFTATVNRPFGAVEKIKRLRLLHNGRLTDFVRERV